jgi:hypothetical protein
MVLNRSKFQDLDLPLSRHKDLRLLLDNEDLRVLMNVVEKENLKEKHIVADQGEVQIREIIACFL